jgi:hypothetical protein
MTIAPKLKDSVFNCCPFCIYCAVIVKNTGVPIRELEANTLVDNTGLVCGPKLCIFHCELPKILTELDWDVRETAISVIELGILLILLELRVKFKSCTLPAVSWIVVGEGGEGDGGSTLLLLLFFAVDETIVVSAPDIATGIV